MLDLGWTTVFVLGPLAAFCVFSLASPVSLPALACLSTALASLTLLFLHRLSSRLVSARVARSLFSSDLLRRRRAAELCAYVFSAGPLRSRGSWFLNSAVTDILCVWRPHALSSLSARDRAPAPFFFRELWTLVLVEHHFVDRFAPWTRSRRVEFARSCGVLATSPTAAYSALVLDALLGFAAPPASSALLNLQDIDEAVLSYSGDRFAFVELASALASSFSLHDLVSLLEAVEALTP